MWLSSFESNRPRSSHENRVCYTLIIDDRVLVENNYQAAWVAAVAGLGLPTYLVVQLIHKAASIAEMHCNSWVPDPDSQLVALDNPLAG